MQVSPSLNIAATDVMLTPKDRDGRQGRLGRMRINALSEPTRPFRPLQSSPFSRLHTRNSHIDRQQQEITVCMYAIPLRTSVFPHSVFYHCLT